MKKTGIANISLEIADKMAPSDPRRASGHYRQHLQDAHIVIDALQTKVVFLEQEAEKSRLDAAYLLSLCVTRSVAEKARQDAAAGMRERAAVIFEEHGAPTASSEAIREIPNPKPKWT